MNNLGSHFSSAVPSDVRAPAYRRDSGLTARDQDGAPQAAPHCLVLLGGSERGGRNETPEIEGKIPRELRGSLYRNGPGLFDRGGLRNSARRRWARPASLTRGRHGALSECIRAHAEIHCRGKSWRVSLHDLVDAAFGRPHP